MAILDETRDARTGGRTRRIALLATLALVGVATGVWLAVRPARAPKAPAAAPRARTTPRATPEAARPEASPTPAPRAEPRTGTPLPSLRVDADVPGANVFLDRKFLGTAPVETRDIEPGPHRLNVSAEGYEMYAETIELKASANEVLVRFKEVRLDERVDVVHKHGVGSCRGRLHASTAGLRYEADKPADSFDLRFDRLEPLEVDYLKRNLRVKERGGKSWNFTAESADALLAFQKAVEKARERLSSAVRPGPEGEAWSPVLRRRIRNPAPGFRTSGPGPPGWGAQRAFAISSISAAAFFRTSAIRERAGCSGPSRHALL